MAHENVLEKIELKLKMNTLNLQPVEQYSLLVVKSFFYLKEQLLLNILFKEKMGIY